MNNIYQNQTPGQFPIVASQLFNYDSSQSATLDQTTLNGICKTAVECGFNYAIQSMSASIITTLLKAMEGTGLKMILGNAQLIEDAHCTNFVNMYKSFATLGGWYLSRLPKFNQISTIRKFYNQILSNDPDHLIYMQLLEGLSTEYTDSCYSYLDYLRCLQGNSYYIKTSSGAKDLVQQDEETSGIKPMIWSNDYDPVSYNPSGVSTIYYASFYKMLRDLRQISLESGHPFWSFCQCEKVQTSAGYHEGTPASMRLQCYSALAYGAQGLIFTSYQQRPSTVSTSITESPISINGKKTSRWYEVQSLISEIRSFTHIFLGGQPVDIRNSGNLGIENFNFGTGTAFGPCDSISSESKGILYVLYKNKTRNYLIIVNHDIEKTQDVTLNFNKIWKVVEETPHAVFTTDLSTSDGLKITRRLAPGGWVIFRYE